jgi:streptogramin lyase
MKTNRSISIVNILALSIVSSSLVASSNAAADVIYVAEEQLTRVSLVQPNGSIQPFANGVGLPYGLTLDQSGNLYVASAGNDTIFKVTPPGIKSVFASNSSLGSPDGLAFDSAGNLYTSGYGWGGTVNRISPNGTITRVATGVGGDGLAFDTSGNLYVAGGGSVTRITPAGVVSTFATGFNYAWGLAFDGRGNLFVSDYLGDSISEIAPNGTVSVFATGLDLPTGLAFGSNGNLYVCNITESQPLGYLSEITPDGKATIFASGLDYPTAIAISVPEPSAVCISGCGLLVILLRKQLHRNRHRDFCQTTRPESRPS